MRPAVPGPGQSFIVQKPAPRRPLRGQAPLKAPCGGGRVPRRHVLNIHWPLLSGRFPDLSPHSRAREGAGRTWGQAEGSKSPQTKSASPPPTPPPGLQYSPYPLLSKPAMWLLVINLSPSLGAQILSMRIPFPRFPFQPLCGAQPCVFRHVCAGPGMTPAVKARVRSVGSIGPRQGLLRYCARVSGRITCGDSVPRCAGPLTVLPQKNCPPNDAPGGPYNPRKPSGNGGDALRPLSCGQVEAAGLPSARLRCRVRVRALCSPAARGHSP